MGVEEDEERAMEEGRELTEEEQKHNELVDMHIALLLLMGIPFAFFCTCCLSIILPFLLMQASLFLRR